MREDLGAALVQVKEDGCCTDARLGLNLLSGNHWMRVVEDVGRLQFKKNGKDSVESRGVTTLTKS